MDAIKLDAIKDGESKANKRISKRKELIQRPKYPECGSNLVIKDGKQLGKQTYLCKVCYRRFTPSASHVFRGKDIKEQAISLYANSISINAISKALKIPFATVYRWVKHAGEKLYFLKLQALKKQERVKAISINESWTFVGNKENPKWIWSIVVEYADGKAEKFLYVGNRDEETFLKKIGIFTRSKDL